MDSLKGADNGPMVINNTVSSVSVTDPSGVEINGTNFPDMMFRLYIMDKLDLDKNLILSPFVRSGITPSCLPASC